jgi:8-amino-3,8-dideoxy-alpha-D-manno-octulosonate transaminase
MPGFEVFGKEEQDAINDLFEKNGGVLFAHGFDGIRNGIYRVREFETAFAKRMGTKYAQGVSSGTAALKVGLKALGVKPGDEVITQSFTFVATVEAILEAGATPVVVEVDETLNICPKSLESAITDKTKVIIPVHMMGAACDMDAVMEIAQRHNLKVLEDTAQACGGIYKGNILGTIGHMGAFSTDAGKTLMTGEGGMVVTVDEDLFIRARAYHDHGHEYSSSLGRAEEGALLPGFNFRMTELQGAIGLVQLSKLEMILEKQRQNKKLLKNALRDCPFKFRKILDVDGDIGDALVFFLETADQTNRFVGKIREAGLGTKNLPDAIRWHFSKYWQHLFLENGSKDPNWDSRWKSSADLLERAVALPVMVKTSEEDINKIAETIVRISKDI